MRNAKANPLVRLLAAVLGLISFICVATPASAVSNVLKEAVPYQKIPDATSAKLYSPVVVFWSEGNRRILTVTTTYNPYPRFCPDPSLTGAGPGVCRADFLIVRANRVAAIGRARYRPMAPDDPAIRRALRHLGVSPDDVSYVKIKHHQLLMPGLVDSHTHVFNAPQEIIDRDGIPVGQDHATRREQLRAVQKIVIRNGITTVGDMYANRTDLTELRRFSDDGELKVRVSQYLPYDNAGGVVTGYNLTGLLPTGSGRPWVLGDRLRVEGVKIYVDGGAIGRRANSYEQDLGIGNLWFPDPDGDGDNPDLDRVVARFHCMGYQVAFHASGDLAIPLAQSAIRYAEEYGGCPGYHDNVLRHRIEHHRIVTRELVRADREYNIDVSIPFYLFICDPHIPAADFTSKFHNWDMLVDRGVKQGLHVAWQSDDPSFSPWVGMVAPFLELHNVITRLEIPRSPWQGLDSGLCLLPKQMRVTGLSAAEALPMMTIESAYLLHREDQVGSLDPGKLADLIILSNDPLELASGYPDDSPVPPILGPGASVEQALDARVNRIRDTHVLMTMIGGRVEFCAEGHGDLCMSSR